MNKVTILGSGTSTGVPILGCKCQVCQSNDTRNKRLRTSVFLETPKSKILVDASPDLRTQLLHNRIDALDAIIITHSHADHTHGIDDLRPFGFKASSPLPVYADSPTAHDLKMKFPYIFDRSNYFQNKEILGGGIPLLDLSVVGPGHAKIHHEDFEFFALPHGHDDSLCFRHNKLAYLIDCREIPEAILEKLAQEKLELLIIDCLRPTPHQTHLHLDLTLEYITRIKPQKAVLTHMGHEWDYLDLSAELLRRGVKNTFPGIDGQYFLYH